MPLLLHWPCTRPRVRHAAQSFLDVLGVNPFPDAPRKAVASAMARFTSASAAAVSTPLLGPRRPRPYSTAPGGFANAQNNRSYGFGMEDSAMGSLLHHSGPDVTAQDYIDMYTSGSGAPAGTKSKPLGDQRAAVASTATVASTVSVAARKGGRQCTAWLLKLRAFLYPIMRVLNWPIKVARNITIPRVEEDCWDWVRWLCACTACLDPTGVWRRAQLAVGPGGGACVAAQRGVRRPHTAHSRHRSRLSPRAVRCSGSRQPARSSGCPSRASSSSNRA